MSEVVHLAGRNQGSILVQLTFCYVRL